jgi:hypothetical protein
VFDVDTNILSLTWEAPPIKTSSTPPIGYVILYKEGGYEASTPTNDLFSWEGYYNLEFLWFAYPDELSFEIDFSTNINKKLLLAIYPLYYRDFVTPIKGSGLLTILQLDTFTGGSLEGAVVLPRGLSVDSEANLYFNNSFLRDPTESPNYFITSKVTPQNVVTGVEAEMTNLTTSTTGRPLQSVYSEYDNSVWVTRATGGATTLELWQYKIDTNEFKFWGTNGKEFEFGSGNGRLRMRNVIAANKENGFAYFCNPLNLETGVSFRGIWQINPSLPNNRGFLTGTNPAGVSTTVVSGVFDIRFENTSYQNVLQIGDYLTHQPSGTFSGNPSVVIEKDSTSFTLRTTASVSSTTLANYRLTNVSALCINTIGSTVSNKWYEQTYNDLQNGTDALQQGFVKNNFLYYPATNGIIKINLETRELTNINTFPGLPLPISVIETPEDERLFVATISGVYRANDFANFAIYVGGTSVSSTPVDGVGSAASFAGIRGMVYSPDGYIYVTDFRSPGAGQPDIVETSNIRRIGPSTEGSPIGVVGPKEAEVSNEDEESWFDGDGEVSTDPSLPEDQTIGFEEFTYDVPAFDPINPEKPGTFTDPDGNSIPTDRIIGRAPGDPITLRKDRNKLVLLRDGRVLFTYLLTPEQHSTWTSDAYLGWYEPGTKNRITTPTEFIRFRPVNGYNYILKTAFTERMAATESPFYYGNYMFGKGFLLFDNDTYVYDRALLDDDINRAVYTILGGRKYYYNDTEFLESPILPQWLVDFLAETPLTDNLIEVYI